MLFSLKTVATGTALALLAAAFPVASATAVPAAVTSETFQLTSDHCTGGCLLGGSSGGTVTVTQFDSNSLTFSIALASGFTLINTGFDGTFAFDLVNNPIITYSAVTSGFSPVGGSPVGAQNLSQFDGFASFEYAVIRDAQGGNNGLPSLSFTIMGTGLSLDSLEKNSFGAYFVADVRSSNGNTGLIDASNPGTPVPEPASMAVLGSALIGFGLIGRRRRHG